MLYEILEQHNTIELSVDWNYDSLWEDQNNNSSLLESRNNRGDKNEEITINLEQGWEVKPINPDSLWVPQSWDDEYSNNDPIEDGE